MPVVRPPRFAAMGTVVDVEALESKSLPMVTPSDE
jgi:hypothetical protein